MSTVFTVQAETLPEVASDAAHWDHLPFLETLSPLHSFKLPNYTAKSLRVRKGESRGGRSEEGEKELKGR